MARTELHGLLPMEKRDVAATLELPFLGLCFCDDDGNVTMRPKSLKELGVSTSRYDAASRLWSFQLDLHDDDLPNADTKPTASLLKSLPLIGGRGLLVAREDWMKTPNWLMYVADGTVGERHIVECDEEDPRFVRLDRATSLVEALSWPAGLALWEALKQRA